MMALPTFWRFADLCERGIVKNLTTLNRLIETRGFPDGRKLGLNTRVWSDAEIKHG